MFLKQNKTLLKAANNSTEETVVHPLPTLFSLLGLTPFKKVIIFIMTCGPSYGNSVYGIALNFFLFVQRW